MNDKVEYSYILEVGSELITMFDELLKLSDLGIVVSNPLDCIPSNKVKDSLTEHEQNDLIIARSSYNYKGIYSQKFIEENNGFASFGNGLIHFNNKEYEVKTLVIIHFKNNIIPLKKVLDCMSNGTFNKINEVSISCDEKVVFYVSKLELELIERSC